MSKLIVFKPTGEARRAMRDDWVKTPRGEFVLWYWNKSESKYPIYTRHEITATPEVLKTLGMEEGDDADETDCPIHGKCEDGECPRC